MCVKMLGSSLIANTLIDGGDAVLIQYRFKVIVFLHGGNALVENLH